MTTICPVCNSTLDQDASACPFCGFKLLGSTQQFRPISAVAPQPESDVQPEYSLLVIRGPQTGVAFRLGSTALTVGRSPKCDIFLNDMTVSRDHADILPLAGGHKIVDKKSFNGIWVNNANVEEKVLRPGDIIQIGSFLLQYLVR